jgi:hypothetical protein
VSILRPASVPGQSGTPGTVQADRPPAPPEPAVGLFSELVAALRRGDLRAASRFRHALARHGFLVIPPATWPGGSR